MSEICGLEEWNLDEIEDGAERFIEVKIIIPYPDPVQFIDLEPKERLIQIDKFYSDNVEKLVALNLFIEYTRVYNNRRTIGVTAKIMYPDLNKLAVIPWLSSVEVIWVDHATKRKKKQINRKGYFCIVMTVVIEVEGLTRKRETTEKRFVLIKAKSVEDAYNKVELQKDAYAEPYLSSEGKFVRWRIDSLDDCYETGIRNAGQLDEPQGVEVYSKLGERKSKPRPIWNGR